MADFSGNVSDTEEADIYDLKEDIELNVGLLASLADGSDTESEQSRQVIRKTIKRLKKRLRTAQQPQSQGEVSANMADGQESKPLNGMHSQASGSGSNANIPQHDGPFESNTLLSPTFSLASRKRLRPEDDDMESRGSKSIRPSPAASAPGSTPNSNFDDDSDGFLNELLSREELEEQRLYLQSLEERKRQEQADEELARTLGEDAEDTSSGPSTSTGFQRPPPAPISQSQSFFRGDGSFNAIRPDPTPANRVPLTTQPVLDVDGLSSGVQTPASSGDEFEEIARSQFTPRLGQSMAPSGSIVRPVMPGAFPGTFPYTNMAGATVYNHSMPLGRAQMPGAYAPPGFPAGATAPGKLLDLSQMSEYSRSVLSHMTPSWMDDTADPAQTAEEIKNLLKHIRPDEELSEAQLAEMPSGLTRPLMPHQITGLAWMKQMEEGSNKGGILADDMGLGKTFQAIALMVARPAPETDKRPNLVVAPVALMHQWKRELEKFVHRRRRLHVETLYGAGRHQDFAGIRNADVVLTTFGTLASELKRRLIYDDKCKHAADPASVKENCAILGTKSKFHRVFLDEAQNIKNRNTKTALAACRINATHRWALTGTPMQNNVEEMYSLIKFCRIRPYHDWDKFSRDIARPLKGRYEAPKERAMKALQALLRAVLLRRTKQSKIDGKPILQLPSKTTVQDRAAFGDDQKKFYEALEANAQIQFNRYIRNGSIGRNYSHALVLLLRLRQACCHPHLITNSKDFEQTVSDLAPMDMVENAKALPDNVVDRLKKEGDGGPVECPICMDTHENPTIFPCGHALCSECLAKLCDAAISSEEGSKASCPHCRAKIDADKVTDWTSFKRVYCPDWEGVEPLDNLIGDDVGDSDSDSSDEDDSDSDDGEDLRDFIVEDDADVEYDDDDEEGNDQLGSSKKKLKGNKKKSKSGAKSKGKGKGKPKAKMVSLAELRKQGLRSKSAKKKYLRRLAKDFQPSAKTDKTVALLEEIHNRGEGEKTIIFSSFTSFLDLLEVPLSRHEYLNVYSRYDGSMTAAARNDAVQEFTEKPNNRVILVSLKAGNAGLNLTAANHVILLDPFWNPFVEYQAADRCYRIGQEREVTIHRVLIGREEGVDNPEDDYTVEDRILKLQEKKKHLVETALDESAGAQLGRLGQRELGYLFGVNNLN